MKHPDKMLLPVITGMAAMLFTSCEDGLLKGLYDEAQEKSEYGFIRTETMNSHGSVYINSSAYTQWVYIDFANEETVTVDMTAGGEAPDNWDMAVHRYDTKTNGGSAVMTEYTSVEDFAASGTVLSDEAFTEDIWTEDVIATDMSGMMDGNIVYAEDWYNPELSLWLDVDTSTMPPVYTMSDKVFVLKTADGRMYALKLENYMNSAADKGYMTIQYMTVSR